MTHIAIPKPYRVARHQAVGRAEALVISSPLFCGGSSTAKQPSRWKGASVEVGLFPKD